MKKNITCSLLFLLILLSGCSKEGIAPNQPEKNEGGLKLRFEKSSTPTSIVTISAVLTRNEYSTITKQLNITGTASAELLISNIVPGVWHLKVNALGENGVILYSGETDIDIKANIITSAELDLLPTGQLKLNVNWMIRMTFSDYTLNPIFGKTNTINNPNLGTGSSFVLFDDNKYKMWYANLYDNRRYDVNYAESIDGIAWTVKNSNPVIATGAANTWDAYSIYPGAVIKENQIYKMYYVGVTSINGDSYIGLATSTDGLTWTKNQMPVIMIVNRRVAVNTVLKYNDKYYLYFNYTNTIQGNTGIGLATSTDGTNWSINTENLIVDSQSWESSGLISPCVRYDGNQFIMVYGTLANNGFGYATSSNGINWVKSNSNPFFTPTNTIWSTQVRYPYLLKINNKYRLYYAGYANGLLSIAFAEGIF